MYYTTMCQIFFTHCKLQIKFVLSRFEEFNEVVVNLNNSFPANLRDFKRN
jgi:hypothetical protein